ncbi:MAG: hypothetical protein V4723_15745 [Pseudomonadota bacterium]
MTKLSHSGSRIFFCVLFLAIGVGSIAEGLSSGVYSRAVSGLAIVLMGIYSFLVPLVLSAPLREMAAAGQVHAIGPARLRQGLIVVWITLLFAGLFMRWGLKL